ncbi:MAG: tetratricopeptide repeat protein, partial [Planctomycetota bacterium]
MQIVPRRSSVTVSWIAVGGLCFLLSLAEVNGQPRPAAPKKPAPAVKTPPRAAPPAKVPEASPKAAPSAKASPAPKNAVPPATKGAPEADPAATDDEDSANAEAKKEQLAADRFLVVLEKNPRRGTALDKVYGFHIERGTLDQWLQQYKDRVAKDEKDGTAWLLLGLIESQRGQDAAAVKAFQKAEQHLPESSISSYYLGQSLVLVGQPDLAAAALERALERKPTQNDLLEIFQTLGRVYQRAQKSDKALEVWGRLEKLF